MTKTIIKKGMLARQDCRANKLTAIDFRRVNIKLYA